MAPYEAIYNRKCSSPICWEEMGEKFIVGPKMIKEMTEKIKMIKQRLLMAQSREKNYYTLKRMDKTFQNSELAFPMISLIKGITQIGKGSRLNPRFIGPFEILEKLKNLAYRLALPPKLSRIHPIFHISLLKKYV